MARACKHQPTLQASVKGPRPRRCRCPVLVPRRWRHRPRERKSLLQGLLRLAYPPSSESNLRQHRGTAQLGIPSCCGSVRLSRGRSERATATQQVHDALFSSGSDGGASASNTSSVAGSQDLGRIRFVHFSSWSFCSAQADDLQKESGKNHPVVFGDSAPPHSAGFRTTECESLSQPLQPIRPGIGTPNGRETVMHTVRNWIQQDRTTRLLTLDLENAFNHVDRSCFRQEIRWVASAVARSCDSSHAEPSFVLFKWRSLGPSYLDPGPARRLLELATVTSG